jgi:probable addiction module antidote protein
MATRVPCAARNRNAGDIAAYITEAVQTDDMDTLIRAIGVAAKARGMTQIAKETGLSRGSLYKALSGNEHPQFETISAKQIVTPSVTKLVKLPEGTTTISGQMKQSLKLSIGFTQ